MNKDCSGLTLVNAGLCTNNNHINLSLILIRENSLGSLGTQSYDVLSNRGNGHLALKQAEFVFIGVNLSGQGQICQI